MSDQKGRGGYRQGAGRKTKTPYIKRKTAGWNVEEWIPQALKELAQAHGVGSASEIVNEDLKALCQLHGRQAGSWPVDSYKTARWRFFSDEELTEVVAALADRWKEQGHPKSGPLYETWLSAWQALEPQENTTSWRHSVLDIPKLEPSVVPGDMPGPPAASDAQESAPNPSEGPRGIELDAIVAKLDAFDEELAREDIENP